MALLHSGAAAAFLVHGEQPPRHVAIDVQVHLHESDEGTRRMIAERYVPADQLDGYMAATAAADVVLLRLRPIRQSSVDLFKASVP